MKCIQQTYIILTPQTVTSDLGLLRDRSEARGGIQRNNNDNNSQGRSDKMTQLHQTVYLVFQYYSESKNFVIQIFVAFVSIEL